jgi:carbamoyl-phosphate synthase large subunit
MEIVQSASELVRYLVAATEVAQGRPVLIDRYLEGKECEVDAVCDGHEVLIPGIMEHIERAGVHSGDSMALYPGLNLTEVEVDTIVDYTTRIGLGLGVRGLFNVQIVITGGGAYRSPLASRPDGNGSPGIYILEVNPRASRTIPFISKVTGMPVARIATAVMLGSTINEMGYPGGLWKRQKVVAIKAPVFSMSKLTGVDWHLGPEMKSTGEVMGIDHTFEAALGKALMAAGLTLKRGEVVLVSIADRDKAEATPLLRQLADSGALIYATEGTAAMMKAMGLPVALVPKKLGEGHPNVVDVIQDRTVRAVVNTITTTTAVLRDGFEIRRAAAEQRIPCFTSLDTARAAVESLLVGAATYSVKPYDAYLSVQED